MNIKLDSSFINGEKIVEKYEGLSEKALDYLWSTSWVRGGIMPDSAKENDSLMKQVESLRFSCEKIFVVASGCILSGIKGIIKSCDADDKVILLGDTLSPSVYGEILNSVEDKTIGLVGISCKEEPVEQIAAFSLVREMIKNRYGSEDMEKRIVIITSKNGDFLPKIASDGTTKLRLLSEDIKEETSLNTDAMIFPISVAGVNSEFFLRGVREVLTSTIWDREGDRYSLFLTDTAKTHGRTEDIVLWQEELLEIANWLCDIHRKIGIDARVAYAPADLVNIRKKAFQTHLVCEEENVDIMTPIFPGASMEGTLSQLIKEKESEFYTSTKNNRFKISIARFDEENIAEIMAFLQMSNEICRYILKEFRYIR